MNNKLDILWSIKESVDKLIPLPAKVQEPLALKPAMAELTGQVNELQASVDFARLNTIQFWKNVLLTKTDRAA